MLILHPTINIQGIFVVDIAMIGAIFSALLDNKQRDFALGALLSAHGLVHARNIPVTC
jgi:hypothetical protein